MGRRWIAAWLVACGLTAVAAGQTEGLEKVELRVISQGSGPTVIIDRGSDDGLAVGDLTLFRPREGSILRGVGEALGLLLGL